MIDTENLRTASLYINNQLLSRGLIRDGHDINFADFGERGLGSPHTASRIIGVLNDLIIRRDRDAEQRESFSTTVLNLRAENLKHTNDIARLSERCAEAQRRSDIAATSEANLKTQLKSAESAMKGLKDELARTKGLVAQVRASCATEIRRRDRQIETLKKQVGEAGRARGTKSSSGILSITVTGDMDSEEKRSSMRGGNLEDKDYSLRSETNSFLASLAQNLSDENETLLRVVQQAKDHLREMSGYIGEGKEDSEVVKPQGWEEMTAELGAVINHMRNILTNPSFVPIEEVMMREEQINSLKEAVLKMESRWEDTVLLMDGWRKRMATTGTPIGEDDIMMGLHLSPVRVSGVEETRAAREPKLPAVEEEEEPEEDIYGDSDDEFSGFSGDGDNDDNDDNDNDVLAFEYDAEEQDDPIKGGAQQLAGAANTETAKQMSSQVTRSFITQRSRPVAAKATRPEEGIRMESTTSLDEAPEEHTPLRAGPFVGAASKAGNLRSDPRRIPVRLTQPRPNGARPQPTSPSKTAIAAKLAASEKQADAARTRAKLRALHTTGGAQRPTIASAAGSSKLPAARTGAPAINSARGLSPAKREVVQPETQQPETRKRDRRVAKVSSRRRSTLSPFELQSLISGNVE
ncbi:hypothetical protein TrVGV298_005844 [Trichoderma virens]|nr:hypothetical protein TrVGV298_005844 [Trichoderma virens]